MSSEYLHTQFGIDEIYIHPGLTYSLLEKLKQRAAQCLDGKNKFALKYASHDMILIFYHKIPNQNFIHRFLEKLNNHSDKENFIKSNTLLNEEELFSAIKSKEYILITPKILP